MSSTATLKLPTPLTEPVALGAAVSFHTPLGTVTGVVTGVWASHGGSWEREDGAVYITVTHN